MDKPKNNSEAQNEHKDIPKKSKGRIFAIGLTLIILLCLGIAGIFPRVSDRNKIDAAAERKPPIPLVQVMSAKPNTKSIELVLPSYLEGINMTPIWARVNGYVLNFYVDIGDRLKAGQLMLEIDTPEIDQELIQAKAELVRLQALLEISRITAERWQTTLKNNVEAISLQEVQEKTADYQSALANVEATAANVQRLEALQAFKKVYAPFDGIVIQRLVDIGTLVTLGSSNNLEQLFQVAKTDVIRAFIDVPQTYARMIKDGLKADITIDGYPNKVFTGTIARNSTALAPIARTLLTQVNIDNPDGDLLVGLYAVVKIMLTPDTTKYIVPTKALIIRSGPTFVAILDENHRVRMQKVEVGLNFGTSIEIISGIKDNDLIIINPTERIRDGVEVKVEEDNQGWTS